MYDPQITGEQRLRLLAWPLLAGLVDTYDEKKAAALFQAFVKNGTWQTPTLAILDGFVHELDDEFVNDPRRRFRAQGVDRELGPARDLITCAISRRPSTKCCISGCGCC